MEVNNKSDDSNCENYFLSDINLQQDGGSPMTTFSKDLIITVTSIVCWLPLGAIIQKTKITIKCYRPSNKWMIRGVTDRAIVYSKNTGIMNNLFLHCNDIDPLTEEICQFKSWTLPK